MIAIAVGLVALVAVIWLLPTATPAHDGQPALTSGERKETPERHASRSRSAETTRAAAQLTTPDARDKETDLAQDEPPLQLTRHGSRATVNLDGGPSTMASFATRGAPFTYDTANPEDDDGLHSLMIPPPAPNPASTCAVTGIVTDAQGLALPGALVLAGAGVTSERTPGREAYAVADEGTVADDTGRFSIEVDASTGFNAVALNEDGWSQLASVPAGTDAVHLDLQIAGGARLQGTVRRANTGVAAVISASPTDLDNVDLSTHSGEDGRYELTLPPGTYRVEATINGTLESKAVEQTVTIPADGSATADFDLPVGTLVAVQIELSDDLDVGDVGDVGDGAEGLMVLEWTLLPGQHALAGPQGAVRVRSELDSADYFHSSSFSLDVDELLGQVRQFVDIESGMWTACAELRQMAAKNLTGVGFSCTQFTVKPGQEVAEVVLTLLAL